MNEHVSPKTFLVATARPREPERRRFSVAEMEAMDRAGILGPEERVELIDGEIITMAAKGARHEDVRNELTEYWARRLPATLKFAVEPALRLEANYAPEPDIIIFHDGLRASQVRGDSVLLVVEISDSSLSYDLKVKGPKYSAFGVREYWVINADSLETHIHRDPGPAGYASLTVHPRTELLTPLLAPALAVRLSDLRLE
jgi:Uma2 family endonuclease